MRHLLSILPGLSLFCTLNAQQIVFDSLENQKVLIGKVLLANISDSSWYRANYNEAIVTVGLLDKIEENMKDVAVEVYFGTWCSDSRLWVPAFLGILDKASIFGKVELIGLPGSKISEETVKLDEIIEKVPTFVFWRDGKEIGRIVESPKETLAKDVIEILKR